MNIEIRRFFEKDALKLPAYVQVQLAKTIESLASVEK